MTRSEIRSVARSLSRTSALSLSDSEADLFVDIALRDFGRAVKGVRRELRDSAGEVGVIPTAGQRYIDLPAGYWSTDLVYYDSSDWTLEPLIELPIRHLLDPNYVGWWTGRPYGYAVEPGDPPRMWFDTEFSGGVTGRVKVYYRGAPDWVNAGGVIEDPPVDTSIPDFDEEFHIGLVHCAAAYLAKTNFDERIARDRRRDYEQVASEYVQRIENRAGNVGMKTRSRSGYEVFGLRSIVQAPSFLPNPPIQRPVTYLSDPPQASEGVIVSWDTLLDTTASHIEYQWWDYSGQEPSIDGAWTIIPGSQYGGVISYTITDSGFASGVSYRVRLRLASSNGGRTAPSAVRTFEFEAA